MSARGQVVKAMAVVQRPRDGALLVSEATDPAGRRFHRPLGGHVEFGEYALDTLHREIREEIGQRLASARLLGVLENLFSWGEAAAHEVIFVFTATFADPAAYEIKEQLILDQSDERSRVIWRDVDAATPPLYPSGLADLIVRGPAQPGSGPRATGRDGSVIQPDHEPP
jgi:ADP-ribose pyrophosphatase YjhB (NUDIX family)